MMSLCGRTIGAILTGLVVVALVSAQDEQKPTSEPSTMFPGGTKWTYKASDGRIEKTADVKSDGSVTVWTRFDSLGAMLDQSKIEASTRFPGGKKETVTNRDGKVKTIFDTNADQTQRVEQHLNPETGELREAVTSVRLPGGGQRDTWTDKNGKTTQVEETSSDHNKNVTTWYDPASGKVTEVETNTRASATAGWNQQVDTYEGGRLARRKTVPPSESRLPTTTETWEYAPNGDVTEHVTVKSPDDVTVEKRDHGQMKTTKLHYNKEQDAWFEADGTRAKPPKILADLYPDLGKSTSAPPMKAEGQPDAPKPDAPKPRTAPEAREGAGSTGASAESSTQHLVLAVGEKRLGTVKIKKQVMGVAVTSTDWNVVKPAYREDEGVWLTAIGAGRAMVTTCGCRPAPTSPCRTTCRSRRSSTCTSCPRRSRSPGPRSCC
ncbi:MAG: hypothetical protein HY216_01075 [Candidatus Rokubacteria bacterium]|nr:hypothetical protein [Candidatus Rokubacteria bacterium]